MRLALPDWKPGKVPDPVQRVRNFLYVAAVPDVFQMQELERFVPLVVYERIQEDIPKEDLIKILYWIATHPFDGDDKAVDELRPLGLFNGPADMEQTRGRLERLCGQVVGAHHRTYQARMRRSTVGSRGVGSHSRQSQSTVRVDSPAQHGTHMSKQTSTLPTRALGTTGMAITRVGFGAWAIGGGGWAFAWGAQDDDESMAAMRHAVERGVNWIDTAAVYGLGHSEELVGKLLRDYPANDRPYVFTKCGLVWDEQNPMTQALRIGEASSLRREVEQSLTRLGVERDRSLSDALAGGRWHADRGLLADAARPEEEGKVRAVGLSNHKVDRLEPAERLGHVDTLQPPFSPIRRDALAAELPWCQAHGTGVIVYSPMQSGLLTGSFTEARAAALGKDDWRSRAPEFQSPRLQSNLALAEALRPIAARHNTTVGAIAVAWTLAAPGVTGAIVGARNPAQVDGWIAAGRIELTPVDLTEIASGHRAHRGGDRAGDSRQSAVVSRQSQSTVSVDSPRRSRRSDSNCRL